MKRQGVNVPELRDLVGSNGENFLRAVRVLSKRPGVQQFLADEVLIEAIKALEAAEELSVRERDRRIAILVKSVGLVDSEIAELTRRVASEAPKAFNAIMSAIPANKRMRMNLTAASKEELKAPNSSTIAASTPSNVVLFLAPSADLQEPAADAVHREEAPPADDDIVTVDFRSVVLLGSEEDHERNALSLQRRKFTALRCETVDALRPLATSICGIVVSGLWWLNISADMHHDELCRILEISSMFFIRIGVDHLKEDVASHIADIQRELYGAERDSATFCHGFGCNITASDMAELDRVAGLMKSSDATQFHPYGINLHEGVLLRTLATKRVRNRHVDASVNIEKLQTSLLGGGRSGAKIVMVAPDDGGLPVIAKLHPIKELRDELRRYKIWIQSWDDRVQPELVTHLGQAALVYRMVDSVSDPGRPAPTLEDRLEKQRSTEIWDAEVAPPEQDIVLMLNRAVSKLAILNKRKVVDGASAIDEFWSGWAFKELLGKGVVWDFVDLKGQVIDIPDILARSESRVGQLHGKAHVHGDVHLRNVLVNDREPILIDFASSGPGHPCYDLVRLDMSVSTFAFRAVCHEQDIARMMHEIHCDGADYERVKIAFPRLLSSVGNRVAVRAAIAIRTASLDVLSQYGGGLIDYMAMRILVNSFALSALYPQSVVARATISASAEFLCY
jgi:hypothetical protein